MKSRIHAEARASWAWWVHVLFILLFWGIPLFVVLPEALGRGSGEMNPVAALTLILILVLLPLLIYAFLGQLRVRVKDQGVEAAWGLSEVFKKTFPYSEMVKAEAVTYSPFGEFGGWGIRFGMGKKKAWTVRGTRALVLHLKDGTRFYLTSDKPERLVMAIEAAGAGKMAPARENTPES